VVVSESNIECNQRSSGVFDRNIFQRRAFFVCAVFALGAVWGHGFPAGIDLPQHANLLGIWSRYHSDATDYRTFYRIQLNTPYIVSYALAYPFAKWFGPLAAVKVVLALSALATPYAMIRWLRAVGGEPLFGLFGFLLAFGFPYQWGFFSNVLAIPLLFAYLAAFEKQGDSPRFGAMAEAAGWAFVLFFCHGISFGVAAIIVGLRCVLTARPKSILRRGIHLAPVLLAAGYWLVRHRRQTASDDLLAWPSGWDRPLTLLSGLFSASPDWHWASVSAVLLAATLIASRPVFRRDARAYIPLGVALTGFIFLPEWVGGAWLVGTRFCCYVHGFAPAIITPRLKEAGWQRLSWLILVAVLLGLGALNVRLYLFNRELEGLTALTKAMEPASDVRGVVRDTSPDSMPFGPWQLDETSAWITAVRGGILENDSGSYFQMPIQRRRKFPFPYRYRYLIARGEKETASRNVRRIERRAQLIEASGDWYLFEAPPLAVIKNSLIVIRFAQGWGKLKINRSVTGGPLSVAGIPYNRGLGSHAISYIRVRALTLGSRLEGACGIDDAGVLGRAIFIIRTLDGTTLFESGIVNHGESARSFSVPIKSGQDLILEALPVGGNASDAHADWLDLRLLSAATSVTNDK